MKTFPLVLVLLLSGCATLEDHPYLAAAGVAIAAGSLEATLQAHRAGPAPYVMQPPPAACVTAACIR